MTKVITFAIQKGGSGKTTMLYNFGEWLAQKYKVLLIDLDYQSSLSEAYELYDAENTSLGIFTGEEVEFHHVKENLSIIPATYALEDIPLQLRATGVQDVYFLLEDWLYEHSEEILKYDFLLIDTHPDTLTVTQNAIATSQYQIGVLEPSEFGYNAKQKSLTSLEELKMKTFNRRTKENRVTTKMIFLGNKLRQNESLTHSFLKEVEKDDDVIALIPRKTLFEQSTYQKIPVCEQLKDTNILSRNGNRAFAERLEVEYNKILTIISED
ncbi:chromosome partitioning protein [Pilibacter termitis]|uniref:Chromosome partitioning protein n=1 Tax=Pilibacter termitis TaxID=263852 RepID=A0A1T4RJU0_9ENTE|nr:ParA family protein [Pilibacter termitis]SKA16046.1 chromosome partitioning protein [Pilibacter termitis]